MRRLTQPLVAFTMLGVAAGIAIWALPRAGDLAVINTVPDQTIETLSTVGLSVEHVTVEGQRNTDPVELLEALGAVRGTPILDIDVPVARQQITALPWVRSAEIVRRLPNRVHITFIEHEAYALWQHDGRHSLVAEDGTVIIDVADAQAGMVVLVGDDAPAHVKNLFTVLSGQPQLAERVKAAVRYGQRRWDVTLDDMENGIVIKLPEVDVATAWDGLAALDTKHGLLRRAVAEIDLRIAGRLVVKLLDGYEPIPPREKHPSASPNVRSGAGLRLNKELTSGV